MATPKRIGRAVELLSTGNIDPSTLQNAGPPLPSACHCGALSVTAETGRPMEAAGILVPSFAAVHSSSVTTLLAGRLSPVGGAGPRLPAKYGRIDRYENQSRYISIHLNGSKSGD